MKTGHERNHESLNQLFDSKQGIKSGIEFSPASGYLKHDILNICDYDRIIDTEDYDEASKRLARYLNPFNYGLNTRDELIKAIKRILIKEGGSSFDKDDYVRHAYAGDIQSSHKAIKSSNVIKERDLGYNDYFKGCKKSDNPYLKDSEPIQHTEWETGWLMAEEDDIDQTNYAKYGSHFYTN